MNIQAHDRCYRVETEAQLLPTLAQIERAKLETRLERRRFFQLTGTWIDENGRMHRLDMTKGRAG